MANLIVSVVTALYLVAALFYGFKEKNWPLALVYFAYALANVGLLWGTKYAN